MIVTDNKEKHKAYQCDTSSLKVIWEFDFDINKELKDLKLVGGKQSEFNNQQMFMAIDSSSIYKVDPRMKQFIVNRKDYKTDIKFSKI